LENGERHWALIVHGGAKEIEPDKEQANREGVLRAAEAGRSVLAAGGSSIDAVGSAIRVLEDLPTFNAGRGSVPNAAGEVEMCSAIMDGADRRVGGVSAIRDVRHPIDAATRLLPEKEVLLAGEGALLFAREQELELVTQEQLHTLQPYDGEQAHDTVGAVALDMDGNLAAGTSTGGLTGSRVGRVGDSPLPGCGLYADNRVGAVALSGDGETISRVAVASQIMARLKDQEPDPAIGDALAELPIVGGPEADGGGIVITRDGRFGWAHNSREFAVALINSQMNEPRAWLRKAEAKTHG
jgi:beta-aspartyl-peptidase (threonine type)